MPETVRNLDQLLPKSAAELGTAQPGAAMLGLVLFQLVSEWPKWIERRVEAARFLDQGTFARHVSVDFILPELPTPLQRPNHQDGTVHIVPLGLLRKQRLIGFDLRAESSESIPLLSRRQNGPLAALVLYFAARAWAPKLRDEQVPNSVLESLWMIAFGDPTSALREYLTFGANRSVGADEDWRSALVQQSDFMRLARELAENFLVLTPVLDAVGRRRVLKFSYEDRAQLARRKAPSWKKTQPQLPTLRDAGRGAAVVELFSSMRSDANASPMGGVSFRLDSGDLTTGTVKTDAAGRAQIQVPAGQYEVIFLGQPDGIVPISSEALTVDLTEPGSRREVHAEFVVAPDMTLPELAPQTRKEWLLEALGINPKTVGVEIPSSHHSRSHHVEFAAPEGLFIESGALLGMGPEGPRIWDEAPGGRQRVHLYTHEARSGTTSKVARFKIRARPETVLRSAVGASVLSVILLVVALIRWKTLTLIPGPALTLLLVVPGALSLYITRSLEHPFATETLFGVRVLAIASGFMPLAAGAALVLARGAGIENKQVIYGEPLWTTPWLVGTLLALAAAILAIIWRAERRSLRASRPAH